jgi:ACS family glucarate transporter-like MFS transporter
LSSISTPIVIGYIIAATGSFKMALVFVGANALLAAISYLFIVGEIKRIELKGTSAEPSHAEETSSVQATVLHPTTRKV